MSATVAAANPPTRSDLFIDLRGGAPLDAPKYGPDRMETYARELAAASALERKPAFRQPLLERFRDNGRFLAAAHRTISGIASRREALFSGDEWLLDNYFIMEQVVREVQQDLPAGYFVQLPVLAAGPLTGYPRIFGLALGLIAHSDGSLDEAELRNFVRAYQDVAPLAIGELWAVPTMLRLGLMENLRRVAEELVRVHECRARAAAWVENNVQSSPRLPGENALPEPLTDACIVGLLQTLRDREEAGVAIERLEDWLARRSLSADEIVRRDHQHQAGIQVSIGNAVTTLRLLEALDWSKFFEENSRIEELLGQDPAGAYGRQDFATRDRYRRAVEQLARGAGSAEDVVVQRLLDRSRSAGDTRARHVGYYLVDAGRRSFEQELHYRPRWYEVPRRTILRYPHAFYFGSLLVLTVAIAAGIALWAGAGLAGTVLLALFLLLPAGEVAVGIVHFLVGRLLPPRVLPKLDFKAGIPAEDATFIVMPCLLDRPEHVEQLVDHLELHYLANSDPKLSFALLTDCSDADSESVPEDEALIRAALERIRKLNERHAAGAPERFFLLHRRRRWNAGEGRWMGWERKRGKLQEFNRLLRGDPGTSYAVFSTAPAKLPPVRFVLTLDTDTVLPRESARRLIATLAHPLNRAQFDPGARRVVAGYALLQPRVSFLFNTSLRSWFARIFAASAGIDPYSAAISDVYQDLFGAGTYTGKGLYEVDAFEAATAPAFPENRILSHDLIESNFCRCGLVTDIELFDDFPARYHAYARRQHRWVRGDWQLLPWLGRTVPVNEPPGRMPNPLPLLARWKIFDNLRRSLVPPAVLALLVLGWNVLPGPVGWWTLIGLATLALPLFSQLGGATWDLLQLSSPRSVLRSLRQALPPTAGQVLLSIVFLADQARLMVGAAGVTLYRLYWSRRHLLEWETAAAAERRLGMGVEHFLPTMLAPMILAVVVALCVAFIRPAALPVAWPLIVLWLLSPLVAWWVSRPIAGRQRQLSEADRRELRHVARKTWGFFEAFVGPDDHWLPPDNFQEDPDDRIAHRTSPTNQGLLLLSTLAAGDLGYVSVSGLSRRLEQTLATLEKLQRHEGHFLNWYDTRTLEPLHPAFVSTVDSGNLLGCLLTLRQGLAEKRQQPIQVGPIMEGCGDTLLVLDRICSSVPPSAKAVAGANRLPEQTRRLRATWDAEKPTGLFDLARLLAWLEDQAGGLRAQAREQGPDAAELERWSTRLVEQVADFRAELKQLAPWLEVLRPQPEPSAAGMSREARQRWEALQGALNEPIQLERWPQRRAEILDHLAAWAQAAGDHDNDLLDRLTAAINASAAEKLAAAIEELGSRAAALADAMDFRFLYNVDRNLFSIGFNVPQARLDNAHYDLLASEASLTSFLAVARGQVPRKHWFQLGRPLVHVAGQEGLLSWGGTMFEYLMPRLVLPDYPGTLLDVMQRGAVARQEEYGHQRGIPWGISESAYNVRDAAQDYQYQSFGVPGLGIKKGLEQDLVVAPYATALATMVDPQAARRNLEALQALGAEGEFGFYEAVDFTPSRLAPGQHQAVVACYMAHHQGMSLVGLANCVLQDIMPRRLAADPIVRANELLLQERVPIDTPIISVTKTETAMPTETPTAERPVSRRISTPHTASPRTHLLSAGDYTVMVTAAGGGFSRCRGLDVTRWREDRTLDALGQFCYVRDLHSGYLWSAAFQPVRVEPEEYEVLLSADKAEFRRLDRGIQTNLEIAVSPEKTVEVRRLTLTNTDETERDLDVTSYAEVVLSPHGADLAHPAFGKLFLQTEWLHDSAALLCRRRPRSSDEAPIWAVHVLAADAAATAAPEFETDRARFLGRRRNPSRPAAFDATGSLAGTAGLVLDPIFSIRQSLRLPAGASATVAFTTALAGSREECLAIADEFHALHGVARVFELAWAHANVELRHLNLRSTEVHLFQRLAGHLLFAGPTLRADADVLAANNQGQPALWRLGISGDLPIVVVRARDTRDLALARQLLAAHSYWRVKGFAVDLVLLNENPASYFEELHQQLQALVRASDAHALADKPGGVFIRKLSHLRPEDRALLMAAARAVLVGGSIPLADQVDLLERRPRLPEPLRPSRRPALAPGAPSKSEPELLFHNGVGGFAADGREYVIRPGACPPAPWCNVVANPHGGFLVTDSGSGYTWATNSQQNRLTPWSNDPVSDPPGEAIYLRDEENGEFWSPTPLPVAPASPTRVRHGAGYTVFEQQRGTLAQQLRLFVPADAAVKLLVLSIRNEGPGPRRLSATFFAEWVLGVTRDQSAMHVMTEIDPASGTLFARNPFAADFGTAVAFADVNLRPRTVTGDRTEFLGRNGAAASPAALQRVELSGRTGAALDPCAALQAKFELAAGAETTVVFVLGQAADRENAGRLAERYRDPASAEAAFQSIVTRWNDLLSVIQVRTPDPAFDLLLNRWLLLQVLSCRLWGRSGFYQSGGAYGFRDQLQDVAALVYAAPAEARAHLLRAAGRQFEQGDVQHWWHPPSGRGVRTRICDDFLWLPFVVHHYVAVTGDDHVLDEPISFLQAPALEEKQEESYGLPGTSADVASLYEHCVRALENGAHYGAHGLPLMGTGDWNDGMNRVGNHGRGESVWAGWFQIACLRGFADLAARRHDEQRATSYRERAETLRQALEKNAWDGDWYLRAFFDDGTPLGSAKNAACRIDSLAQTWAVLSGAGDSDRARRALAAVSDQLVRRDDRLVLLFAPPFDAGPLEPGYIKGYVPGVRENGGQYSHGATWVVQALAELGEPDQAKAAFDILSPIHQSARPEDVARYRVEPYVVAGDVYSGGALSGRGGWTWYTGSAAWLYRVGLESILGFRKRGSQLHFAPHLPGARTAVEITYRHGATVYHIVLNGDGSAAHAGVRHVSLDGKPVSDGVIHLVDDGGRHEVRVEHG